MTNLRFSHATNRNTKAYTLDIGPHRLFISCETVIAYDGPHESFRLPNLWGPTTGRHMNEMGVREFPVVKPEKFDAIVAEAMGYEV